ncbi:MAG: tetratricopeptide repeat protein [Acidobacteriia bacterium]|nr:tetratricopeptide repeat protein [Terriglobia bacterium]
MRTVLISLLLIALGLLASALKAQTKPAANPGFAALAAKANAARDAGRLDEAVALYHKALALRPGWAEGWWSLGTIEYDQSAYAEAERAFQTVTVLAPKNGTAYVMLGLSEFELGHDDLSLRHIQKGTDLGLDKDLGLRHVVLYHEGVLLQRKGKFEAAQETLEQLCLQGVQNDEIANALGMTLLRLTTKNPPAQGAADADIVVRIGRAECLAGQKKYDEARPGFETVVKENPNHPNIHYAYGLFLLEARDLPAGVEQLKQEIANNPGHVFARLQIAAAQYKEDSAAGIPYAEEAVKLSPGVPFGHYLLGLLLLDADESARAIPELEIAQKTFSRDPKVYFALGSAYSRVGRKLEAARARATFEQLSKEQSKSNREQGIGDTAGQKIGSSIDTPPPQ